MQNPELLLQRLPLAIPSDGIIRFCKQPDWQLQMGGPGVERLGVIGPMKDTCSLVPLVAEQQ